MGTKNTASRLLAAMLVRVELSDASSIISGDDVQLLAGRWHHQVALLDGDANVLCTCQFYS